MASLSVSEAERRGMGGGMVLQKRESANDVMAVDTLPIGSLMRIITVYYYL